MYQFSKCNYNDLEDINRLMASVDVEISNPNIFVSDDETFVKRHIKDDGFILKAMSDDEMVAFLLVRYPKDDPDNLARDIKTIDEEKYEHIAHMESVVVAKDHRGNNLQYKLIVEAEKILENEHIEYSMATVSPINKYSLINFVKADYVVTRVKNKYTDVKRIILKKDID
ncbi:MAG: GNAT family N-acetyltransferase [Candidatus Izemoplasma sp.]|nr:GNAT family N-acetyltransferase [Candidatus Izemoplasma sp.]